MIAWKAVDGFPNYLVSNTGLIKSLSNPQRHSDRILSPAKSGSGYYGVLLYRNKKRCALLVHRIVARAFLSAPLDKGEVNHVDGNKLNNNVNNLVWCTHAENCKHMYTFLQRNRPTYKTAVVAFDKQTNREISSFESVAEAVRRTGIKKANICRCCVSNAAGTKRFTAGGIVWKYAGPTC